MPHRVATELRVGREHPRVEHEVDAGSGYLRSQLHASDDRDQPFRRMAIKDFGASRSVISAITISDCTHADHLVAAPR
jgi:hypothetical protein